ncbi:MAG: branched-chain amino acid ABC transporter permease [Burkholderiaceae bacterium]|nr:branched-chain amino acid ABC transporter permease [Burkholderiaceae bacterium]
MPPSNSSTRLAATRAWLLAALVCIVPLVWGQGFALRFGAEILLIGAAVMSLNLLIGLGGLVSLGHGAVFGCAAYAAAAAAQAWGGNVLLVLAVGVFAGMAIAGLMALLTLRSTGLFFLVLTLVVGQMAWEVVFRWREVTGGADGLRGFPGLDAFGIRLDTPAALYTVACVIAGLAWWVLRSFARAPVGLALQGMRDQPLRMRALGYSLGNLRVRAFLVSGAVAGAAGALFPFVNQYIGPNTVHWSMSATLVIMSVLGGIHVLLGGFAGAAVYLLAQTQLSSYTDRWQLAIGLLFVATVMFAPNGLLRLGRRGRP